MNYNKEYIIDELKRGRTEEEIAQELSAMLNAAVKEKAIAEDTVRTQAITSVASALLDSVINYFHIIGCANMSSHLRNNKESIIPILSSELTELEPIFKSIGQNFDIFDYEKEKMDRSSSITNFANKTASGTSPAIDKGGARHTQKSNVEDETDRIIRAFLNTIT